MVLDCESSLLARTLLPTDKKNSDMKDQVWIWDNGEGGIFYFDVGETVRFRVEQEEWHDQVPTAPDLHDGVAFPDRKPPYSIIVCSTCTLLTPTNVTMADRM